MFAAATFDMSVIKRYGVVCGLSRRIDTGKEEHAILDLSGSGCKLFYNSFDFVGGGHALAVYTENYKILAYTGLGEASVRIDVFHTYTATNLERTGCFSVDGREACSQIGFVARTGEGEIAAVVSQSDIACFLFAVAVEFDFGGITRTESGNDFPAGR